jgi:acyl-coenzyme A synthetase/AMP-(fatty) acid ligase/acyl carrier protein
MSSALFGAYAAVHAIDVLKITPSHLSSLLNNESGDAILPRKYLIVGGEATRGDLVERIQRANRCALLNHYGPTEATVGCCTFGAESDVRIWEPATLPIGKPIANDAIYIVDSLMQPTPIGVAGELCIGGAGLAQGYLKQPTETAERFVRNPFSSDLDARIYRTGDLARFLPDGNIEFLGRIDAQVKIRGFRVEPAEIESVLRTHPSVDHAAIVSYESNPGEKKLAAYVVSKLQIRAEDLRAFLAQELPEYMVPSAFVLVDRLPLTPNGKLDLRALPKPEQQAPVRESVAPRNPEEENLALIWREVLKRDSVGVTDNFFELGGHSLLATQIISRIRNTFHVQMPLHSFLQSPTIASLAEQIGSCPAIESEEEEMTRLLQELEGISDEEAERLLTTEPQKNSDRT